MSPSGCSIEGCSRRHEAHGLCGTHYQRWRKHGSTDVVLKGGARRMSEEELAASRLTRFWSRVDKGNGKACWVWIGMINDGGYGRFDVTAGVIAKAHRFAYEICVGPVPAGLDLDHVCHTLSTTCPGGRSCLHRRCVRPDHLQPVTRSENLRRGVRGLRRKKVAA